MTSMLPEPYPYQQQAIEQGLALKGRTGILAPPGSGKTRIAIDILTGMELLREESHPLLVACSGAAIATWIKELQKWAGLREDQIRVVSGTASYRLWAWHDHLDDVRAFICNYTVARIDALDIESEAWGAIVCDEYHKAMLRHKRGKKRRKLKDGTFSQTTWEIFERLGRRTQAQIWISGSYLRRDPSSMWTLFHMIDGKRWSSYWRWVHRYCVVEEGAFTRNEIIGPKNTKELGELIDEHCLFIPEEVVADQLPEGNRTREPVQLTATQKALYEKIRDEMLAELDDGGILITPHAATQLVMLRQILCSPRLADPNCKELGGGLEYIVDQIDALDEDTWHFAVFVPFRDACDVVAQAIREAMPKRFQGDVEILRGGIGHDEQARIIRGFKAFQGPIVGTIQYAESYELETCRRSFFLGYDYILDVNKQAEGRTRRAISQHKLVNWHYLCYSGTVDEHLLEKLNTDQANVNRVLKSPTELRLALLADADNPTSTTQREDD